MVRGSAYIWKNARKNIPDLPEPLPGMSEPAFAALCFESVCTVSPNPQLLDFIDLIFYSPATNQAPMIYFGNFVLGFVMNVKNLSKSIWHFELLGSL